MLNVLHNYDTIIDKNQFLSDGILVVNFTIVVNIFYSILFSRAFLNLKILLC